MKDPASRVRNDQFDARAGFDRGRSVYWFALWHLVRWAFFVSCFPWPSRLKVAILRLFGAKVGQGVYIKPRVSIHIPWKIEIGDYSWIGEEVTIVNFEPIVIGANCCISQRAFLVLWQSRFSAIHACSIAMHRFAFQTAFGLALEPSSPQE